MFFHQNARTPEYQNTVAIGGGIAGLTAAWRLKEKGMPFILLEQSSQVGGSIRTMHAEGYLLELGPNTFLNSSTELWKLAESVGLKSLKIETPPEVGKKRYIFKKNRLIAVPSGPKIIFSPILSLKGRLRLLAEPFIKGGAGRITKDESLSAFITRRFGKEVLDMLVTPFVSGIYAGDPENLSIEAIFPKLIEIENKYGSIFKGMKELKGEIKSAGLGSFQAGMQTLPQAIESQLKDSIIKNARVTSVRRIGASYQISYEEGGEEKNILADSLIMATPAYVTANLLADISPELANILSKIEYAPIIVVHLGYKKDSIPRKLDGFGFLVPRKQKIRILGCLWSSALFPERAPSENELLTCFLGGMLDKEACDLSNEDIMQTVQKDMARTMKIKTPPSFACITRYTHAIPQYNIGHIERIEQIKAELEKFPGLSLTGSCFTGISVASAIEHANNIIKLGSRTFWGAGL